MKKKDFSLFAATGPGLEAVCAAELQALGFSGVRSVSGGVEFGADLAGLYRANLWSRSANRVLARLGTFRARDFPRLYQRALALPWGRFVKPETPVEVRVSARRSRLMHTDRIAETVSEALDRSLGRADSARPVDGEPQRVLVRIEDDECRISVDSSGDLLHRRGYRREAGAAPLRETLAAGLLMRLGWDGSMPLYDPFCGSGTIPIEAALLASRQAPGAERRFAFMRWPRFRPGLWQALLEEASRGRRGAPVTTIVGSDRDAAMVEIARRNADRAAVAAEVSFRVGRLKDESALPVPGLLFCNPPYGARLGQGGELEETYRLLGRVCRERFAGWRVAFLCPEARLAEKTGLPLSTEGLFSNGGLRVRLYRTE